MIAATASDNSRQLLGSGSMLLDINDLKNNQLDNLRLRSQADLKGLFEDKS